MAIYLGTNKVNFSTGDITTLLNLQTKTVSPTTSLQTITADSGYHALQTVKVNAMPTMTLPTAAASSSSGTLKATINRSTSNQYINIPTGYNTAAGYYLISATPNGSVTAPSSISGTSASVSTGTNTLTLTKTISVTPNVTTAGYISAGTAGNSSVSLTASVTTKAAATYTPTISNQTIGAGTYLTGAQTIKGDANLLARNIKNGVTIFNIAGSYHGPEDDITDAVRFFDYDGTIKYSYSKDQFLALSAMPANPSHTGLVAQGWNWTLADAKTYVTEWGFLDIGQMYTTSSGATEIDIVLPKGRQEPYLMIAVNGTVSVNWGDGSAASTITGTSVSTRIATQHIYTNPGAYTIKISITNGSWAFYTGSSSYYGILNTNTTTTSNNRVYSNAIKAIRIGNGDIRIVNYAFYYNSALNYITIPSTVTFSSTSNLCTYCYRLRTFTFPNTSGNITSTGSSGFASCYNLSFISFSPKVTSISSSMIQSCYNLKSFYIPTGASCTGAPVDDSTMLGLLRYIAPSQNLKIIQNPADFTSLLNGLSTVSSYQFGMNHLLKELTIPNTITSISGYGFTLNKYCSKITIPTNTATILQNNYLFSSCYALQSINIPNNITTLGAGVFDYCYALLGPITLPSTLTALPGDTFEGCYSLESLTMPNTITTIGNYFCANANILNNITFSSTLTTIGTYSVTYAYSLTDLTIPSSVTSIGNYSFQYCYNMKEIHMLPTTPPTIGQYTFRSIPADCTIYVPSASLATYQSATNWATYASQMVGV